MEPRTDGSGVAGADRPAARPGPRSLLAGLALLLVAVPFGLLLLLVQVRWGPLAHVDGAARDDLHRYAVTAPWFVDAMQTVSALGTAGAYLVGFGVLVVHLLRRGCRRLAAYVVVTLVGGTLLNDAVKTLVDRARPVLPDPVASAGHSSFPSGHAQGAAVACGVLLVVLLPALPPARRRLLVAAGVAWVLLVGFSRVALGVHYVSDVLAGWVLGVAWLLACTAACGVWPRGTPPTRERRGAFLPDAPG